MHTTPNPPYRKVIQLLANVRAIFLERPTVDYTFGLGIMFETTYLVMMTRHAFYVAEITDCWTTNFPTMAAIINVLLDLDGPSADLSRYFDYSYLVSTSIMTVNTPHGYAEKAVNQSFFGGDARDLPSIFDGRDQLIPVTRVLARSINLPHPTKSDVLVLFNLPRFGSGRSSRDADRVARLVGRESSLPTAVWFECRFARDPDSCELDREVGAYVTRLPLSNVTKECLALVVHGFNRDPDTPYLCPLGESDEFAPRRRVDFLTLAAPHPTPCILAHKPKPPTLREWIFYFFRGVYKMSSLRWQVTKYTMVR
ncbi:BZ3500_MvSof-1268-A1-R1_Chr5-2g08126 [Microbotryum saponariae]|uniref:BZ3500_MvSof-1268-A1-R1_Chr5-2g08126 protein n=1 Tax=Microbotryum saponariae TaxID=289078 RepID=A0A2X0KLM5_9BASI|nr:BZ3500_MvSof-1268-A1-R1_Chr5-2g08126 [Microbotryum saponariae]SDA05995.1 BZ3501_MvSof-1269-A2-R1_Chr5-2g07948 [Microbotryum saponariae]